MMSIRLSVARSRRLYAMAIAVMVSLMSLSPAAPVFGAEKFFACTPANVAAFPNSRIHVKCSPGDGAITFFAFGVKDDGEANRLLSLLTTALVTKKRLDILYDPNDLDGAKIGCLNKDCRLIRGAMMF
ncbi:MAG: hypothetical protein NW701_18695 [Nitrospira sp.]